jgi:tyrosyl-DNA phosphodiesterase 2
MLKSLLQKQLTYVPIPQPFFAFCNGVWTQVDALGSTHSSPNPPSAALPKSLHLITWNIDFMACQPRARMKSALNYLEQQVSAIDPSSYVVVFLQEMVEEEKAKYISGEDAAQDLSEISNAAWVQQRFNITDLDSGSWLTHYGLTTLVDRRLDLVQVSRLQFVSEYRRDALFVDIRVGSGDGDILRLCNVHLDSMTGSLRPIQWKALARHLQDTDAGIKASIVAGDCNANKPRDATEPQRNRFRDAYLELGGVQGDEAGATWGFQSLSGDRWGRSRLDKEVYWGRLEVRGLQRIGIGIEVSEQAARRDLEQKQELLFVTDHYGLLGEFQIDDGMRTVET